ncbi:hypothetical protein R0K19_23820, partial [Bacillus sp. SIMBA_161]
GGDLRPTESAVAPHMADSCVDPDCVDPTCSAMEREEAEFRRARAEEPDGTDIEPAIDRIVESAVMKGIFGTDVNRRMFLRSVGGAAAFAA